VTENICLKFYADQIIEGYPRLIASKINNINSIRFIGETKKPYLKFNLADGGTPKLPYLFQSKERLSKLTGSLASFDTQLGFYFNSHNLTSFFFIKRKNNYELNMAYIKGPSDCFNAGVFSDKQFEKMPCDDFFEYDYTIREYQ